MRYSFQHTPLSPLQLTGAIKWLIITNVVVYVFQVFAGRSFIYTFGLVPYSLIHYFRLWQLFTYMFLHGGIFHLLFNLFILWMFGKSVEDAWGTKSFLKYYFICGLGAAIAIVLTGPNSTTVNIGASGAIYGILVAFAMLYPETIIYLYFLIPVKAKYLAIILGVIAFLAGISGSGSGIAHFGHLGGLLVGYLYLKYPVWKYRFPRIDGLKLFRRKYQPKEEIISKNWEEEINRILDKILAQGVDSLTIEEKKMMDEYVQRRGEE
ncbi:MAG TPA: DUF1751 domain-containing protein [Elusimicrobia bacterium]|jgi:membrane associated rhomboid family serine protease|nr:DUF1751 domain-containing protein [Elusimicrobiota bacterium]